MRITLAEFNQYLHIREPNNAELVLINNYRPSGASPYEANELIRFTIMASNNLIHQSLGCWDLQSLETMIASFGGADLMLDHNWEDGTKTFGFVYDQMVVSVPKPSNEAMSKILKLSPSPENDRKLIEQNGYHQVLLFGVIEKSHPITSEILYRRKSDVSIGGHFRGDYVCPLCNESFFSESCNHYPPMYAGRVEPQDLAPFYIRSGIFYSVECSLVASGNCIQAKIIDENLSTFVMI